MIFRFGRFELDESKRELRLDGAVRELQPRVFDLLAHLLRHHERVVSKEELLSTLWPDVIVTDSSIMRAVSVIRSTLREGEMDGAIQTFSRQGYRFVGTVERAVLAPASGDGLRRVRAAIEAKDWQTALDAYTALQTSENLTAQHCEEWAEAALCLGRPAAAITPLERAAALHAGAGDRIGAARAALMLTNLHLESRALAIAKGWHSRAEGFLAGEKKETREHGLFVWLSARVAMFENDLPRALEQARRAEALGRRIKDADVEVLGFIYGGHVELATDEIRAGLKHMDEAGAAVLSGAVSPWISGIVFCSIIWAYLDRGDLERAGQWTDQFTRWIKQNTGFGFAGLCHLHRGEVLCAQGNLADAEAEIQRAREQLAENARYAEGDAWRVLGEIRLLRGDWTGAEEAFHQANELGWHPIPGWALLQAQKGRLAAALKALQRALEAPTWADGQRRGILLAHLASIAARAGEHRVAEAALSRLEQSADLRTAAGCEAVFHQARGEVALAQKNFDEAVRGMRDALAVWINIGSRINAAHVRLRLAEILIVAGDFDEAELELASAEKAFAKMEAKPMVARCEATRNSIVSRRGDQGEPVEDALEPL